MARPPRSLALHATTVLIGVALFHCSSSSAPETNTHDGVRDAAHDDVREDASDDASGGGIDANTCYPDNNGVNGGDYTFDLVVDDTGFYGSGPDAGMKDILNTENDARVTVNLKNTGTKPHGFKVGCVSVASSYPNLPEGCPTEACFPANATIAPLAPGASASITFDTPTPDNLIYPFTSNEPADSAVKGLNDGQWTLM